jgi:hypothetical protein
MKIHELVIEMKLLERRRISAFASSWIQTL